MNSPWQLPLGIGPRDDATFANFYPGSNVAALAALKAQAAGAAEPLVYVWGGAETGRSHLLQAVCHEADDHGLRILYLPLKELGHFPPLMLEDLERLDLLAIDDVDYVVGRKRWEEGLFHCFNRMRDASRRLVIAANAAPRQLDIKLPDLASRLGWGATFHLQPLDDEQRTEALKLRAQQRGMELPDEVARYIMHRGPRRLPALFAELERLDTASLSAHRRLTIPFVKQALDW
ncbi:DnaA regulatory inactivator Hda [Carnimonas nigrificans]|uniref:DnaA regulatory inactivator Hda n=1 Tax=Carnimonas nigrificans TaxID=64323 RepID=UPI00046F7E90|nr:DnaA regulatory inactivator Hda [Carnimonas nigrificans]